MADQPEQPSAFPVNAANLGGAGAYSPDPGMSLRDWFAGQALPGVLIQCAHLMSSSTFESKTGADLNEADFAEQAYAFADAMMAARAKTGGAA